MTAKERLLYVAGFVVCGFGFLSASGYLVSVLLNGYDHLASEIGWALLVGVVPASLGIWMINDIKNKVLKRQLEMVASEIRDLAKKNFGVLSRDDIGRHLTDSKIEIDLLLTFMLAENLMQALPNETHLYQFSAVLEDRS